MQPGGTWDHLCSYEVSTGLYDVEYLEALFDDDKEAITQIESLACKSGFGPLASCPTAWNNSSVKVHCHEQWFELGWNQNLHICVGSMWASWRGRKTSPRGDGTYLLPLYFSVFWASLGVPGCVSQNSHCMSRCAYSSYPTSDKDPSNHLSGDNWIAEEVGHGSPRPYSLSVSLAPYCSCLLSKLASRNQ